MNRKLPFGFSPAPLDDKEYGPFLYPCRKNRPPVFTLERYINKNPSRITSQRICALQDGLEPTTPWLTVRCSNQLSYWSSMCLGCCVCALQDGLEPTTPWLTVRCSNQLSYWSIFCIRWKLSFRICDAKLHLKFEMCNLFAKNLIFKVIFWLFDSRRVI